MLHMRRQLIRLSLFILLFAMPTFATGSTATTTKQTPHFRFQYPHKWSGIAMYLLKRAEKDLQDIEGLMGYKLKGTLEVRLATGGKTYAEIQPGRWNPHAWVAGLAYPRKGLMTIKIRAIDGPAGIHQTFRHELSHLLLARAASYRTMPLWFVEGVAMIQSDDIGGFDRYTMLSQAHLTGVLPHPESLQTSFPTSGNAVQVAYATSTAFLMFLQKNNPSLIKHILQRIRKGETFMKSLTGEYGFVWKEIMRQWKDHLDHHYSWIPLLSSSSFLWLIAAFFFVFVYLRVRRRKKEQMATLEDELTPTKETFTPYIPTSPQHPNGESIFDEDRSTKNVTGSS
ncbi:MAG TPA: hypothetical protein DCE42_19795 [Myxococcales bacterium]|nr:hypothetical protein [Deltaproteobacteria bacterium]MBU54497.1 hypothetical protein [Deltaproteobacteria bacterium]HAA57020.1 hypothetical protein [Myxococcales bacterium]